MENIKCPKCRSEQITANKKGFSGGKAVAGAVLTGGIGLLAGTIGSKKVIITCLTCGHQFKPGEDFEAIKKKKQMEAEAMKSPGFWIFFSIIVIGMIWLISKCSS
jgi:DNA-directed RNA polymerase subunit RPC12/RpoP